MNKLLIRSALLLLVLALVTPVFAQLSKDTAIKKAESVLKSFQDGKTADIVKELDATMTQALPEAKLKEVWAGLVAQFGAFKGIEDRREGTIQGSQVVELICGFEKGKLVQRVAFDKAGKIAGLYFQPESQAVLPASK